MNRGSPAMNATRIGPQIATKLEIIWFSARINIPSKTVINPTKTNKELAVIRHRGFSLEKHMIKGVTKINIKKQSIGDASF